MNSRIKSIKQSPLNPQQWCLDLACGHDVWVTAKQRPRAKKAKCPKCAAKERAAKESHQ